MRYSYDISTKEKEISYANLVDKYLLDLGFEFNKSGTRYLRDLILTAYFLEDYEFFINNTVEKFLSINNIHITPKNFLRNIQYSIENVNYNKIKKGFYSIFNIEYNNYYLTPKNVIVLFLNLLNKIDI